MPEAPTLRAAPPPMADGIALFLDVDGALVEFVAVPDQVMVDAPLLTRLSSLHEHLGGALALVSGRSIAVLDLLFAPLRLPCAGLHGLQRRHGDVLDRVESVANEALARVRDAALAIAAKYDGTIVEDKGVALAFHWRAEPLAAADFEGLAATAVMELHGYHLQRGDHVVELRPAGADKGSAIAAFMAEPPFAGRLPVFVGDDLTDEHGFEEVNLRGGYSILVGAREPSAACYALHDVAAVHRWLGVEAQA